jgi:hypothetical protein
MEKQAGVGFRAYANADHDIRWNTLNPTCKLVKAHIPGFVVLWSDFKNLSHKKEKKR